LGAFLVVPFHLGEALKAIEGIEVHLQVEALCLFVGVNKTSSSIDTELQIVSWGKIPPRQGPHKGLHDFFLVILGETEKPLEERLERLLDPNMPCSHRRFPPPEKEYPLGLRTVKVFVAGEAPPLQGTAAQITLRTTL